MTSQASVPLPTKGLRFDLPVNAMGPEYARRLDNWICERGALRVRDGQQSAATGLGTLTRGMRRVSEVYAAGPAGIRPGPGATASWTNAAPGGDWTWTIQRNEGGQYLLASNGVGPLLVCNGLSWAAAPIVDIDPSTLIHLVTLRSRIFAIERGTSNLIYLLPGAVQATAAVPLGGAARRIPMGHMLTHGGVLVGMAIVRPNGGQGGDDMLAVVSSAGELVVLAGSDVENVQGWSVSSIHQLPPPVGKRPLVSIGTDVAYFNAFGVKMVSSLQGKATSEQRRVAGLTEAIQPVLEAEVAANASGAWGISETHDLMLIHRPDGSAYALAEGGWSLLTGIGAADTVTVGTQSFGISADGSIQRWIGYTDNGAPIGSMAVGGYTDFRNRNRKVFKRLRPQFLAARPYVPKMLLQMDYAEAQTINQAKFISSINWTWPEVTDTEWPMPWAKSQTAVQALWRGAAGCGTAASLICGMKSACSLQWSGCDVIYETGGM